MLFAPDLRDWVRKDDMVHFVIEAVEQAGATVCCSMGQEREPHQPRYDFKRLTPHGLTR